jgi:hypothetical protein
MGWRVFFKKRWNFPSIAETFMMCFVRYCLSSLFPKAVTQNKWRYWIHWHFNHFSRFNLSQSQTNYSFFLNLLAVNRHPTLLLEILHLLLVYCQNYTESEIIWRKPANQFRFRSVPSNRHILIRRSSCGQYF